ncbi:Mono-functional DNA-alkylating methyl methanesulfonate [Gracilaria domingensis]|nr:Mono-functional DNA-alkylating methyl methanesulfonate [Gracilaria domingensis]
MRMAGETQDQLVVITEKYKLCILRWNPIEARCHVVSSGDMQDHFVSSGVSERMSIVDPKAKCIALHQYKRLLKVVPTERDADKTAFNVRLVEDTIFDMVFLYGCQNPTVAVLCAHGKENRELRTYEIRMIDQDIAQGSWKNAVLDVTASKLVAVPEPVGGVLVFGDDLVTHITANGEHVSQPFEATIITAVGMVDEQGTRYLIGDQKGYLSILLLITDQKHTVTGIKLETLGETSTACCISYLDSAFAFIGSHTGDSQLVRLRRERSKETGSFVEVVQTYSHLGPILDFCIVKGMGYLRHGQGQVVTCSGQGKDGSLRIIRNGIGISEHAAEELPGIKDMFSLRRHIDNRYDSYLLQSFTSATRTLELISADEMAPAIVPGFDEDTPTLYAANMEGDIMVQVTTKGVQVTDAVTMTAQPTLSWAPPANMRISVASGNTHQLLLATTGGNLILLKVDPEKKNLIEVKQAEMEREISCLNCNFLPSSSQMTDVEEPVISRGEAYLAVVGLWAEVKEVPVVKLLALPSLRTIETIGLGGDVIARSVLLATLEGHHYLLVGLGDGYLLTYSVNSEVAMTAASSEELDSSTQLSIVSERRKLSVGTQPAQLSVFRSRGANHVFAACDRPTVVYSTTGGGKLLVSNVNLQEVTRVCGFDTEAFPDSLAIATENGLHLGEVDEIQKLHITSVPLGEQPRRIAHMELAKCFGVITETSVVDSNGEEILECYVRIIDDSRYDTLSKYKLKTMENGNSILATTFTGSGIDKNEQFLAVGTAFDLPGDEDPKDGRMLIFRVIEGKAILVAERECHGAVYSMNSFNGMLIISVGPEVQVLSMAERKDGMLNIRLLHRHRGHTLAYRVKLRGDFVLVGDVMRSISVLSCRKIGDNYRLEQLARDYEVVWVMAIEMLDDDTYMVADHSKHLYTFKRNSRATSEAVRERLERVGQFHLGARVNGIEHGSLVMQLAENESPALNTMIFGTTDGMLGVIATLKADAYQFFVEVQNAMATLIPGVGGLKHSEWREMKAESPPRSAAAKNFVDGDLIERGAGAEGGADAAAARGGVRGSVGEDTDRRYLLTGSGMRGGGVC